uniref:Uncharacterized protein n=1 Tax=Anopheles albimanus TaxID=7167 RepID=A0A182FWJ4_ANOAL
MCIVSVGRISSPAARHTNPTH